jgi:hypothetical protein
VDLVVPQDPWFLHPFALQNDQFPYSLSFQVIPYGRVVQLKLTASPHFPEKRIGYLGMMLLLTEKTQMF